MHVTCLRTLWCMHRTEVYKNRNSRIVIRVDKKKLPRKPSQRK